MRSAFLDSLNWPSAMQYACFVPRKTTKLTTCNERCKSRRCEVDSHPGVEKSTPSVITIKYTYEAQELAAKMRQVQNHRKGYSVVVEVESNRGL